MKAPIDTKFKDTRAAPTWDNQMWHAAQLRRDKEVMRHARVSLDNGHYCHDCFCCADTAQGKNPHFISERERTNHQWPERKFGRD